jgi:pectinesterase
MKTSTRFMQPFTLLMGIWSVFYATETMAQEHPNSETVRFVLAGDSTVTDDAGWGKGFAELCSENVECINLAASGRSSRSYRTEGRWQKCLDAKPDYLLIQFGHNDQAGKGPERESAAADAFRDHLRAFIDESRAVGIEPVLITPLTRRTWTKDGSIASTLTEYAEATMIVAKEKKVPLIDLHSLSIRHCEQLGPTAWRALEPMSGNGADHTHLNPEGGRAVAALVVTALREEIQTTEPLFSQEKIDAATVPLVYSSSVSQGTLQLDETDSFLSKAGPRSPGWH